MAWPLPRVLPSSRSLLQWVLWAEPTPMPVSQLSERLGRKFLVSHPKRPGLTEWDIHKQGRGTQEMWVARQHANVLERC